MSCRKRTLQVKDLYLPSPKRIPSEELFCNETLSDIEEEEDQTIMIKNGGGSCNENNNDYEALRSINQGYHKVFGDSIFVSQEEQIDLMEVWKETREYLDDDGFYFPSL